MKEKISQFKKEISDLKELSSNAISHNEKLADEIITGLLEMIEEQHEANMKALEAIGDYGTMETLEENCAFNKPNATKDLMFFISHLFDKSTSIKKQLEAAFDILQKTANKKIEEIGEGEIINSDKSNEVKNV